MDLQISVFLLFILFTAGHSLSCYECMGLTGSCADQTVKKCPSGSSQCESSTAVVQFGDISSKLKAKDCASTCESGSMNLGTVKATTSCCNTELCNLQDPPDHSDVPNGKTCYSCEGQSCTTILSCSGTEDRCIKATVAAGDQSVSVKGCASKSVCDATTSVAGVSSISCCEGNLCNGAQSVSQSFLFLCCSLLSYFLLH
ncbi:urokinase plasminogen activator surface receptor-like isoform X2 [Ctenopharyngodon idella]|uniref:urokinase plasminogen activator surface receptor-like isoform X1 n=1 Tax=Ctenopharyngodon idella TaxID=7959 RepID=UPI00222E3B0E|nr:urokinase plasminogen activator surface receptor-like isoform X1 [Ctenopharyngodon idella]XP_051733843.1 urokinase plasminogen activator surface receptor-like isoform X2 [Ctenopharyngodon idella]